ncbi:MAG: hypothetical protein FWG67_08420 [Defluviitaleaceae bacterium]|nr:hypothetical protein [Defluviitaleaceae bacterium]
MTDTPSNHISYEIFLNELSKEFEYLQNGGTSYRVGTATFCLELAHKVSDVTLFLEQETAKKVVLMHFPYVDTERLKDVTKMLNTVATSLELKANLSDEIKELLLARKRKRKPLKLTPIS